MLSNDEPSGPNGSVESPGRLHSIIYLANAIDLKCEKAESALTVARKEQLEKQVRALTLVFQREYATYLEATESEETQNLASA